ENAESLFRPEDLSGRDVPAEAAGAAQPLRFGQEGLAALQRGLCLLAIFDVGVGAIPANEFAALIAQGRGSEQEPAIAAIETTHTRRAIVWFFVGHHFLPAGE